MPVTIYLAEIAEARAEKVAWHIDRRPLSPLHILAPSIALLSYRL